MSCKLPEARIDVTPQSALRQATNIARTANHVPDRPRAPPSVRHAIPALLLLGVGLIGSAAISVAPRADTRVVAAVMRPGATIVDAASLAEHSDAALLRAGALSNIWIFASN